MKRLRAFLENSVLPGLLLSFSALVAGAPAAAQDAEEQVAQLISEQLEPQMATWDERLRGAGYFRVEGSLEFGASGAGESATYEAALQEGLDYAIVAVCDNDCGDLDLTLRAPNGSVEGGDYEDDSVPIVQYTATSSGNFAVEVSTITCSSEPCFHAYALYVRNSTGPAETPQSGASGSRMLLERDGSLAGGDDRLSSGEFADRYEIEVEAGGTLVADLTSSQFDTYLFVKSPSGEQSDNDDWEGDTGRSRVEVDVLESGTWLVVATSFEAGETGRYRLEVTQSTPGGPVEAGSTAESGMRLETGELSTGDDRLDSGEYFDTYTFTGSQGEQVVLDLRSSELDPYLILISPSEEVVENDDFEGDASRSVISQTLTESGEYRIAVTSYAADETGRYSLRIQRGASSAAGPRTERGALAQGDEELRSGEFADVYRIEGQPGQTLVATVESSEFDTYLMVRGPNDDNQENDDLEGRPGESEVEMTLAESGEYRVVVTSYQPGETGAYTLRIRQDAPERAAQRQRDVSTLPIGSSVRGALQDGDGRLEGGEYRDLYVFDGEAGQSVSVIMTSSEFDTYVGVVTPSGENVDNDDWEGSTDESRVELTLPETGRYRVFATSYQAGEAGEYELSVGTAAVAAPGRTGSEAGPARVLGVFVGVSDYGGRANDLAYTADDAHRMAEALQRGGGMRAQDAVVLTDRQATRANVEQAIREVGGRAGPDDMFVFFYSGHGARVERDGPQMTDPDSLDETLEFFDRGITDDEFSNLLSEISPGISMLVLDACFSGGFSKDVVSVPGRMGFFSSEEDVTSSVAAKFRAGGYLAHFMADAVGERLADANADGGLSAIELSQYLYERYRADVKSGGPDDFVRTGGPQLGYQHLVVDRGSIGASQVLFRR